MDNFKSQNNQAIKKKKKRWTPKGRQVEQKILLEIQNIFSKLPLLIQLDMKEHPQKRSQL